ARRCAWRPRRQRCASGPAPRHAGGGRPRRWTGSRPRWPGPRRGGRSSSSAPTGCAAWRGPGARRPTRSAPRGATRGSPPAPTAAPHGVALGSDDPIAVAARLAAPRFPDLDVGREPPVALLPLASGDDPVGLVRLELTGAGRIDRDTRGLLLAGASRCGLAL